MTSTTTNTNCWDCGKPATIWGPMIVAAVNFYICDDCAKELRALEASECVAEHVRPQPLYILGRNGEHTPIAAL